MEQKRSIGIVILILAISFLACRSDDLFTVFTPPTLTPTFELARFSTPTATAPPDDSSPPEPTVSPTPTRQVTPTATATTPPAEASPAVEAEDNDEESVSESPPPSPTPAATVTATSPPAPPTAAPTETPVPTPAPLSGRIAFPVDDGAGHYDIWVVELPDGEPFQIWSRARQPIFSNEGRLLLNLQESEFGDHIAMLDANYAWQGLISDSPNDSHPYWHPDGIRYVFSNPQLLENPLTGDPLPHVFIPCSLRRPSEEEDVRCRDIQTHGKVSTGEYPVWTDDDRIAFFYFEGDDGIYVANAASGLWENGSVGIPQLLVPGNGRPTDTQGFQVFFSAGNIDQNWEAYQIDLDGSNLINLSNSPTSSDGLPTVSPDGNWVAFVSDRDGLWGIWGVPRGGGEPIKLVDFSKINTNPSPWGTGDRDWTLERISWGP